MRWKILFALPFLAMPAGAAELETGRTLFLDYCAQCHGEDGRGEGPLVEFKDDRPQDLRKLSARNDGHFPFALVVETIDGRVELNAHGERFMPAWGDVFKFEEDGGAALAHARILNLVWYLNEIQD